MKFHRGLIAIVLLQALLLPAFAPLLGLPQEGSQCGCQGDSCCLRHGRLNLASAEPGEAHDHGEHHDPAASAGPGHDGSRHDGMEHAGMEHANMEHGGHGSHLDATRQSETETKTEGAACHGPEAAESSSSQSGLAKISATCGGGSPFSAPLPIRRDAIPRPADRETAVLMVSFGAVNGSERTVSISDPTEPPTPPPRSS